MERLYLSATGVAIGWKYRDMDGEQLHRAAIGSSLEVWMTEQPHGA